MGALHIVDDTGQQVLWEVALLQLVDFGKHEAAHLLKGLSFLGDTHQDKAAVVVHQFRRGISTLDLHGLVQVEVEKTSLAIAQHTLQELQRVGLQTIGLLRAPSYPDLLGFLTNDGRILGLQQFRQGIELRLADIVTRLPIAKILLDNGHRLVWVEVATHADGHIVGHIPLLEIVLDIGDGRIL